MSEEAVRYAKARGIATITLNRPSKANTLRVEVLEGLDRALADANQDPAVKVIVLEGAGDNFCGGFDFSGGLDHYAEIQERRFSSWRMGRVNLNRVNQGTILRFSETATLDPFSMPGETALALLEELTSTAAIVSGEEG